MFRVLGVHSSRLESENFCFFFVFSAASFEAFRYPPGPSDTETSPLNGPHFSRRLAFNVVRVQVQSPLSSPSCCPPIRAPVVVAGSASRWILRSIQRVVKPSLECIVVALNQKTFISSSSSLPHHMKLFIFLPGPLKQRPLQWTAPILVVVSLSMSCECESSPRCRSLIVVLPSSLAPGTRCSGSSWDSRTGHPEQKAVGREWPWLKNYGYTELMMSKHYFNHQLSM